MSATIRSRRGPSQPAIQRPKKIRTCIFCDGKGLSKEDFWPTWLRNHIPSYGERTRHQSKELLIQAGIVRDRPAIQNRPGSVTSRRLRVVCKKCNNGWMSGLQEAAKPLLLGLARREWRIHSEEDRRTLTNWIVMFTMVAEFLNRDRVAVPNADRKHFYETRLPPDRWKIWACWHGSEHVDGAKVLHGTILHEILSRVPWSQVNLPIVPDSQVTTAICGDLLFQVFSSTPGGPDIDEHRWATTSSMSLIHPGGPTISSNPTTVYGALGVDLLHRNLIEQIRMSRGSHRVDDGNI